MENSELTVRDVTSAQHGWKDFWVGSGTTIGSVAHIVRDDWDVDTAECVRNDTTRLYHINNKCKP